MISDLIKPVLFEALHGSWEVTNALGIDKGPNANGYTAALAGSGRFAGVTFSNGITKHSWTDTSACSGWIAVA
jgi:hypothetical protein